MVMYIRRGCGPVLGGATRAVALCGARLPSGWSLRLMPSVGTSSPGRPTAPTAEGPSREFRFPAPVQWPGFRWPYGRRRGMTPELQDCFR